MATTISNVPGSSRPAGSSTPLDVIQVDTAGNPIESLAPTVSGLQPQLIAGQSGPAPSVDLGGNTRVTDPALLPVTEILAAILLELKTQTFYLKEGLTVNDEPAQVRRDLDADANLVN